MLSERSRGKLKINPAWPNTARLNSCEQIWLKDVNKKSLLVPVTSWTKPNWAERCLHNSGDLSPVERYAAKVSKGIQLHVWYFYLISPWCSGHSCQYSSQAEMERADGAGSRWKTSIFPKYLETEICMSQYTHVPAFHLKARFNFGKLVKDIYSSQWFWLW